MGNSLRFEGRVLGVEGVREMFSDVSSGVRQRVRSNLIALGKQGAEAARANAPRGATGQLRSSIRTFLVESADRIGVVVKTLQPDAPYGYFLEFGVVNRGTRSNKRGRGGKRVQKRAREELMAAGKWRIPPRPWFGAARAMMLGRVRDTVNDAVREAIGNAT